MDHGCGICMVIRHVVFYHWACGNDCKISSWTDSIWESVLHMRILSVLYMRIKLYIFTLGFYLYCTWGFYLNLLLQSCWFSLERFGSRWHLWCAQKIARNLKHLKHLGCTYRNCYRLPALESGSWIQSFLWSPWLEAQHLGKTKC